MGYRILYFYKKEHTFYRERKETNLSIEEKELDESVKVFFCGLPEYYRRQPKWRKRMTGGGIFFRRKAPAAPEYRAVVWNSAQLLRLMQNCCEYVSADAYYLEEQFGKELEEGGFGFTPGRQRMCRELIRKISGSFRGIDSILYLKGETEARETGLPLPQDLLRKLHYFFYLGEKSKQYEILEENLWQEYGMPVIPVRKVQELAACQIKRLLVLDDRQEGGADWKGLPKGCVYLDLWSDAERCAQLTGNRADIKYVSEYLYLRRNLDT